MSRLCRDVETSLGRPLHTLSEAERLHLEQHLGECDTCRRESALSRAVSDMIRSQPSGLSESARERALAGAFVRAAKAAPMSRAAHRGQRVGYALAAAAVLLLGLRVLRMDPKGDEVIVRATPGSAVRQPSSPVAGLAAGSAGQAAARSSDENWIESASDETRQFGGARVAIAAGTRLRFERAANTLELARGRVTLDVAHQHERPFAVLTRSFRVEVLGTQFVVSPEHVEVLRGHVQVRERDSDPLISDLLTGQVYTRPAALAESATSAPVAAATPRAEQTAPRAQRRAPSAPTASSGARGATPAGDSASELIRAARTALGSGDTSGARTLVARAGRVAQRSTERAEVGTLEAECELLARRPEAAIAAYLRVADHYSSLRAGENALFAAAQLSLRGQEPGAARTLFQRYLTRYPAGRFADEARAHLLPAH